MVTIKPLPPLKVRTPPPCALAEKRNYSGRATIVARRKPGRSDRAYPINAHTH